MKKEEFIIPIAGLKEKVYHFEYELEESFFDPANELLVSTPAIRLQIIFDKTNEPYVLNFRIEGDFEGECDRCGSLVRIPIEGRYRLFVEFGQPNADTDETEVIYISRDDHEISLYEHVRDFVYLSIPMVKRCSAPDDIARCNETVEAFLKQVPTVERKIDPRWEALKKLKQ